MAVELANRACRHGLVGNCYSSQDSKLDQDQFTYITTERYSFKEFFGIMIDSGASRHSTAGYGQFLAYKEENAIAIDTTKAGAVNVQFGIGSTSSLGSVLIETPLGLVEFHVVKADTPFLLSLADMDRLGVYFDNIRNVLVRENSNLVPVI